MKLIVNGKEIEVRAICTNIRNGKDDGTCTITIGARTTKRLSGYEQEKFEYEAKEAINNACTGLTPEQVAEVVKERDGLQGIAADLSRELGRKNVECAKLEDECAGKERYTTELYSRARDAERERDDIKAEFEAWKSGKIGVEEYYALKVQLAEVAAQRDELLSLIRRYMVVYPGITPEIYNEMRRIAEYND